jgi:YaiO family outer membrane protein
MKKWFFSLAIFLMFSTQSYAQISVDSLFMEARRYAFKGQYPPAIELCKQIANQKPGYIEPQILLTRIYAWSKQYDSARVILHNILKLNNKEYDILNVAISVESWSGNLDEAIKYCQKAEEIYPDSLNFTISKAQFLVQLKKYDEALIVTKKAKLSHPDNQRINKLLYEIKVGSAKNSLAFYYNLDVFEANSPSPWHLGAIQYSRVTKPGSLLARLNYADRFGNTGWQLESDFYPRFSAKNYAYLNIGYSDAVIFPKFRFGAEVYQKLPANFEASLGLRYLNFSESKVTIYTAYIGKYVGNYWFSLRSFVTPSKSKTSVTGIFLARKYFSNPANYLSFQLSYGISPDDKQKLLSNDTIFNQQSFKTALYLNRRITEFCTANISFGYERTELTPSSFRNVFSPGISITYKF